MATTRQELAFHRFENILREFEEAHDDYLFRGSKPMDDQPYIEVEYKKKRDKLIASYRKAILGSTPKGAEK